MTEETNACPLAGICGGCFYVDKTYRDQLSEKADAVRALLEGASCEPFRFEGIEPSPLRFCYRNKMEYSFGDDRKDGPLTLGLHRKKSFYDVVNADCCLLVHPDFNAIVRETRAFFDERGITYKDRRTHLGFLRYLIVRRAVHTGEILVDLVTTSQPVIPVMAHRLINDRVLYDKALLAGGQIQASDAVNCYETDETMQSFAARIAGLAEKGLLEGKLVGVLHTVCDSKGDAVRNEGTRILYGTDSITETLLGLRFRITPFSFFQTNSGGAEVLYEKVRSFVAESLSADSTVFDLYAGTGTIAQMLAPCVKKTVGVEIVPEAAEAARENAAANGLSNCTFIAGDVLSALDTIPDRPDVIILDPPRDGVHPKALPKILRYRVPTVVYVSCRAESLARDLLTMQEFGYRLEKAGCVDQFPWTKNIETVALFRKKRD